MTALRWVAGIFAGLGLAVFVLAMVVGRAFTGFRSGSGVEDLWREAATVGAPLLLAGMLVSVFVPGSRTLLHVVAAGVMVAVVVCLREAGEHPGEMGFYLVGFGAWLGYYYLAAWQGGR